MIHLGPPLLNFDPDLTYVYGLSYQFCVDNLSTSSPTLSVLGPWFQVLTGSFTISLAVVTLCSGTPDTVHSQSDPHLVNSTSEMFPHFPALFSIPTATKQVLSTFHLDNGDSLLARLPASSHYTLLCVSSE